MSTSTLAPSFSKTLSVGFGISKSTLYWSPEQPPPTTFTRSACPSRFSAAMISLIRAAARSVTLTPAAIAFLLQARSTNSIPSPRLVQRRNLPEAPDLLDHPADREINLFLG